ncbi:type II toxin-antitoxin system HicA family toxin [Clostridiales bacterium]|nr:type II toxin-antitoxin system HicA family toxin [Clostridiales bacterium]
MPTNEKIFQNIMSGSKDNNIKFRELQKILDALGFQHRVKGDHFIYRSKAIEEIINIQPDGNKAKPYQVKQVRDLLSKHKMEV